MSISVSIRKYIQKLLTEDAELPIEEFEGKTCLRGDTIAIITDKSGVNKVQLLRNGRAVYEFPQFVHYWGDDLTLNGMHCFAEIKLP